MASAYSNADGMMLPVGLEWPSVSAWLMAFLSKASAAARRAPVVPWRLRIPLQRAEVEPLRGGDDGGNELEPRRALHLLAERAPQRVGDVGLAALEHGEPGHVLGHDLPHQALDGRRLAPVAVVRLEHQLDAGIERRELVRSGPDRRFLEALVADLLDVLLRHDPTGSGGGRGVERQEIRPRLLQPETHPVRVDDLDRRHLLLQKLGGGAAVALEAELHVFGGQGIAVVKDDTLPQHELVAQAVLGHGPGLRQRRRHGIARHRLHHGVVQRVEHLHDGDDAGVLGGVEPRRGDRDVHRPRHLVRTLGSRGRRGEKAGEQDEGDSQDQRRAPSLQGVLPSCTSNGVHERCS